MNEHRRHHCAEPFFLTAGGSKRFCLYHAPHDKDECRGAFVYVHPFAEEMNKSRRMAALQAKQFSSAGFAVLQIDLFGCGDSDGDFVDARWDIWKDDLTSAMEWLEKQCGTPPGLWGLRLGALLALDYAAQSERELGRVLLWQPVLNGESYITQFLRMRLASEMISSGQEKSTGTQEMRKRMSAGENLEIAGYELSPALAAGIDSVNASDLILTGASVDWLELVAEAGRPLPPAAAKVAAKWTQHGVDLHCLTVPGPAFWTSQEITDCPPLLEATGNLFHEVVS